MTIHGTGRLLYGIPEVADMLSIRRTAIYKLIAAGELERVKIGRRAVITGESIADYVGRLSQNSRLGA